jgi:hypothetical protein
MSSRRVLTVVALLLIAIVLVGQVRRLLADPTIWPPDDFIEYWSAAKLTLEDRNPYDPSLLLLLQQAAGRKTDEAVMMWNPPWSLSVVLPLGLLPPREAQLLWLVVNFAATVYCGDRLWLLLGGRCERRWLGWAIALAAMPTLFALQAGQIGPLLLLGAVLFLECERRGWSFAAGAATVLLAVKPHLAYLVWVAIGLDAIVRGRWRIVLGGIVAGLACSVIPLAFNINVWQQYADAMANRPPSQWLSPTLGSLLRLAFDEHLFRLQFVPMAAGLVWFAWHWRRTRYWDWREQLPLLLLVSFVTAPYGAWPFDMVLLLPAAIALFVSWDRGRLGRVVGIPGGLAAINLGCLILNLLKFSSFWFLWVSPAVLLLYAMGTRQSAPVADDPVVPAPREREAVPA